jgi:hypothetical protein
VIVEGDLNTANKRVDLLGALPADAPTKFVMLSVGFDEAWRRARADLTRGISRDRSFLAEHYRNAGGFEPESDDLNIDTEATSLPDAARKIASSLLHPGSTPTAER